jgi:translation initiation factor 2B subunit (eIF-2B alpha/beta/delta family)
MSTKIPTEIHKQINNIQQNNTSGSRELAIQAAELFLKLVKHQKNQPSKRLKNQIIKTAQLVIKAQPTMASIIHLSNQIMLHLSQQETKDEIRTTVQQVCTTFLQQANTVSQNISSFAYDVVPEDACIIVHSYSSVVFDALSYAFENQKKFSVICTESRPVREGEILAKKLAQKGIETHLIVDAAVYRFLPKTDVVFVGADAVSVDGVINKIGTSGLALATQHYMTKCYCLCSTEKFLPKGVSLTLNQEKDPHEITKEQVNNITPLNYYFDRTPLTFFTGFITEQGVMTPQQVLTFLNKIQIDPELKRLQ